MNVEKIRLLQVNWVLKDTEVSGRDSEDDCWRFKSEPALWGLAVEEGDQCLLQPSHPNPGPQPERQGFRAPI